MSKLKKLSTIFLVMLVLMSMLFTSPGRFGVSYAEDDITPMAPAPAEAEEAPLPDSDGPAPQKPGFSTKAATTHEVSSYGEFHSAVTNGNDGDTIILKADIEFPAAAQAYAFPISKSFTIKSDEGNKRTLDLNHKCAYLLIDNGNKCTFENTVIKNAASVGIWGAGQNTEITLSGTDITDCAGYGIYISGIKALTFKDSSISCTGEKKYSYGISSNNASGSEKTTDILVSGSTITDCTVTGIYANNIKDITLSDGSEISGCGSMGTNTSGGGINSIASNVYLSGSTVSNNKAGSSGGGINVQDGGTLTIVNSTISSNEAKYGGGIRFHRSTVTIKGTEITGNKATATGGAMYANESDGISIGKDTDSGKDTVISENTAGDDAGGIMLNNCTGAEIGLGTKISENTAGKNGGGVNAGGSTLIIKGATVSGNKASEMGGGVYLSGTSSLKMSETTVTGNEARTHGGGVAVNQEAAFSMEISDILNNKAKEWYGGGIFFNGKVNGLDLRSGTIKGNYAYLNGGGIYMPENSVEEILDAVIYNNVADNQGGGLWACPAGHTSIFVNEGFAVFDNKCRGDGEGHGTAGDDLVVQLHKDGESGEDEKALVSRRMLGGFENHYYYDGALTNKHDPRYPDVWEVDKTVPRYKTSDREPSVDEIYRTHLNKDDSICLKNVISDEAKTWAKTNASLVITENHARLRGGGVATNGALSLGEKGVQLKTVSVRKEWDSKPSSHCEVELHQYDEDGNNELLETVTLTADMGWKHTFTELPVTYVHKNQDGTLRHGSYTYKIREVEHAGWRATCAEEKAGVWVVKNHRVKSVSVSKVWEDHHDRAGLRPASVKIQLMADGEDYGEAVTLSEANKWVYTWDYLPEKKDGKDIVYTVRELTNAKNYTKKVSGDMEKGFTVTNTLAKGVDTGDRNGMLPYGIAMTVSLAGIAFILRKRRSESSR